MFISSVIHNSQKNGNNSNVHQLINKQNVAHPNNGILFGHKKEWSTNATTWINLENIMLCERSQSQKTTVVTKDILWFFNFHVISFI